MSTASKMPARIAVANSGLCQWALPGDYASPNTVYIRADIAEQMAEALHTARLALTEAEAILGGEYGDHHSVLCKLMLSLDQRANAALTAWEASNPDRQASTEGAK
jgi:hypothetical protein